MKKKDIRSYPARPYEMYLIRDTVGDNFGGPMLAENDKKAIRAFHDGQKNQAHPEDFALYYCGLFFPDSGEIRAERPVFITDAAVISSHEEDENE